MEEKEQEVKDRILQATVELLRRERDVESVSMRKIAAEAGVAVSMLNYHYRSKEQLVNLAVRGFISSVITGSAPGQSNPPDSSAEQSDADPVERMRRHLKSAASFLAAHPGISRVSILQDLKNGGQEDDNSSQTTSLVTRQLREIRPEVDDEIRLELMARIQVAAVQNLFLRAPLYKEQLGLDFFQAEDRDRLMDFVIDTILG
ncbi:MAG TPA: TetR/AcrR family transcriptional regulator, partial [Sediminispirochaeta sp.]|nr:TetR/AcrR family transcriptional regulator [Sediminispirochaeta sp.]